MSNRTTPPTARGEQARQQLIHAAIAQFGEYGLHATTRDIAAQAQQNIAAITYYFGSKEALYLACAHWIADFIENNFQQHAATAEKLLKSGAERQAVRQLIVEASRHLITLLTADETLNISKFISREQLAPTEAYQLIHQRVTAPMHELLTRLIARYCGRDPGDTETILHTHALLGEILAFRLGRETILLRAGWQHFDAAGVQQIIWVVTQHIDLILQGLSVQRGADENEK